jgi:hypothetical protein
MGRAPAMTKRGGRGFRDRMRRGGCGAAVMRSVVAPVVAPVVLVLSMCVWFWI